MSILEVYNETINDLLVSGTGEDKLEVRQGEFGNYVPGLTTVPVSSLEEVSHLLSVADRNRCIGLHLAPHMVLILCSIVLCFVMQITGVHQHERALVSLAHDAHCEHSL